MEKTAVKGKEGKGKKKSAAGAKKKGSGKKTSASRRSRSNAMAPVLAFLQNEVVRFVAGVVFAILSIFTFVSLLSYLFTWAEDQSLLSDDNLFSNIVTAENIGGKLGFLSANLLVSRWFGLGAFIIPFFFAGVAVYCFRKGRVRLLRLFALSLMGCIVLSTAFSFIFSFTSAKALFGDGASVLPGAVDNSSEYQDCQEDNGIFRLTLRQEGGGRGAVSGGGCRDDRG